MIEVRSRPVDAQLVVRYDPSITTEAEVWAGVLVVIDQIDH